MERLEKAGRQPAALPTAQDTAAIGRAARDEARHVLREAWRQRIEHQVQLTTLGGSGLAALDNPGRGGSRSCCAPLTGRCPAPAHVKLTENQLVSRQTARKRATSIQSVTEVATVSSAALPDERSIRRFQAAITVIISAVRLSIAHGSLQRTLQAAGDDG
jgi:hypothetical protein